MEQCAYVHTGEPTIFGEIPQMLHRLQRYYRTDTVDEKGRFQVRKKWNQISTNVLGRAKLGNYRMLQPRDDKASLSPGALQVSLLALRQPPSAPKHGWVPRGLEVTFRVPEDGTKGMCC